MVFQRFGGLEVGAILSIFLMSLTEGRAILVKCWWTVGASQSVAVR